MSPQKHTIMNQNLRKEKVQLAGQIRRKMADFMLKTSDLLKIQKKVISRPTLNKIQKGDNSVKFESYYAVLDALNKYEVKK